MCRLVSGSVVIEYVAIVVDEKIEEGDATLVGFVAEPELVMSVEVT